MKEGYKYCPICATTLELGVIEGKERKYCPSCDFIDYKNPLPVALAIPTKNKRLLMIRRGIPPKKGAWGFPSGFVETGETSEEACLRELKEETGVSGEVVKLVGVVRLEDKELYGDMLVIMYLVKVGEGELTPGDEVEDAKFVDVDDLPDYYRSRLRDVIEEIENEVVP